MKKSAVFLVLFSIFPACYPSALLLDGALDDGGNGPSTHSSAGNRAKGGSTARGTIPKGGSTTRGTNPSGGTTTRGTNPSGGTTTDTVPTAGSTAGGAGPSFTTSTPPRPAASYPACGAPYANVATVTNQDQLVAAIAGDWYLCGVSSAFCTKDEMGLRVNADGTWTKLYNDASGGIVEAPSSATLSDGTWVPSFGQGYTHITNIGFRTDEGGYITFAQFTEGGEQMAFTNTVCTATYVKSTAVNSTGVAHNLAGSVPVELHPTTEMIDGNTRAQCDPAKSNFDPTSLDTMQTSLAGIWMLCPPAGQTCSTGEVGIEFGTDGRWSNLYADGTGLVYRGLGSGRRGDYRWVDNGNSYYTLVNQTYGDPLHNYTSDLSPSTSLQLKPSRFASSCSGYYQKL